jgi:hypothetical protein
VTGDSPPGVVAARTGADDGPPISGAVVASAWSNDAANTDVDINTSQPSKDRDFANAVLNIRARHQLLPQQLCSEPS